MGKRSLSRVFSFLLALAAAFNGLSVSSRAEEDFSLWKQGDPRWNQQEAWPEDAYPQAEKRTMEEAGDQVTALAMVLMQYEVVTEPDFSPWECVNRLKAAEGFDEQGNILWFRTEAAFPGLTFENSVEFSFQKLEALYQYGHPCILKLKGQEGPHYVAVRSVSGRKVEILDPGSENRKLADPPQVEAVFYFSTGPRSKLPEYAKFPAPAMEVTQLAYESFSHGFANAVDIIPHGEMIAPFRCTVTFTDPSWGYVVLQSTGKVLYPDGTFDYMTVSYIHSEDIRDLVRAQKEGRILCQGEPIYHAGGMGRGNPNKYREHVHMAAYRGHVSGVTDDGYYGCGDLYPYDAFLIDPSFTTKSYGRGEGYKSSDSFMYQKAPDDYRGRWKTIDIFEDPQ